MIEDLAIKVIGSETVRENLSVDGGTVKLTVVHREMEEVNLKAKNG
jgi:hypothetical protein